MSVNIVKDIETEDTFYYISPPDVIQICISSKFIRPIQLNITERYKLTHLVLKNLIININVFKKIMGLPNLEQLGFHNITFDENLEDFKYYPLIPSIPCELKKLILTHDCNYGVPEYFENFFLQKYNLEELETNLVSPICSLEIELSFINRLILFDVNDLAPEVLGTIISNCQGLEFLKLTYTEINEDILSEILACPTLKAVNLHSLAINFEYANPLPISTSISRFVLDGEIRLTHFHELLKCIPSIEILTIPFIELLTGRVFSEISTKLEIIRINNFPQQLKPLIEIANIESLQMIQLQLNGNPSSRFMDQIATIPNFQHKQVCYGVVFNRYPSN